MPIVQLVDGKPLLVDGKIATDAACCCDDGTPCGCPVTLANCTLTVNYTGGTIPDPAPMSPVALQQFAGGPYAGQCGVIAGEDTLRFCDPPFPPKPPCSAGIQAVIVCDSCCQVADSEGRQPGDVGYVETIEGVNCQISDSTFTGANQTNCDACYEGAFDEVPNDITLTLECDPGCGENPLP